MSKGLGFLLIPAVPVGLVFAVLFLMLTTAGGSPAQAAACIPAAGPAFKTDEVPNGWGTLIEESSRSSGIPAPVLAAQLDTESGWNPNAVSAAGAQGLAQFMPGTWQEYGQGDPFNPAEAIAAQGRYMQALAGQVKDLAGTGEELMKFTLAAYNAGPAAVAEHRGMPPYAETQAYVERIMDLAQGRYAGNCAPAGGSLIGELGSGTWTSPLPGAVLTSGFGARPCPAGTDCNAHVLSHRGVDLARGGNALVLAPTDMRITVAEHGHGGAAAYGTYVVARQLEAPHLVFEFHHLVQGSLLVKPGDTVAAGTPLGVEGSTGNSSGVHLHFQIDRPGAVDGRPQPDLAVDPVPVMKARGIL